MSVKACLFYMLMLKPITYLAGKYKRLTGMRVKPTINKKLTKK